MVFYHISPILQFDELNREYHIKMYGSKRKEQSYFDNSNKCIWSTIKKYILDTWKTTIKQIGTDFDSEKDKYIWIHIDKQNAEKTIDKIIENLNDYYLTELRQYMIPKLMSLLCRKLKSEEYFAESLCEYQAKVGKDKTKEFIHIYFRDIKHSQLANNSYLLQSDSD